MELARQLGVAAFDIHAGLRLLNALVCGQREVIDVAGEFLEFLVGGAASRDVITVTCRIKAS